mgnify:CR=1 FL=1
MSFIKYLRERWITYTFIVLAFTFSAAVYKLDRSFSISASNAYYIAEGWLLLFIAFVAFDYGIFDSRVKKFKRFCSLNASSGDPDEFAYPADKDYA